MSLNQASRFCRRCNRRTLHARERFSDGMGCLLTLLTGGLFILLWIAISISDAGKDWRCQTCGSTTRTTGGNFARAVSVIVCLVLLAALAAGALYLYGKPEWWKWLLEP